MAKFRSSLAILWVFAAPLWAQTVRPRLDVSISDESGLPILGARIEIAQQSRVVFEGDTNDLGHISFLELRAGVYTISAKKDGYFAIDPKEISLSDSPVTIAFTMLTVLTQIGRAHV